MGTIGIIIPAYNSENFLAKAIESVLAQTVTDWRLIIVDDGSKDTTYQIAQSFSQKDERIRVCKQSNSGVAKTRNNGYQYIKAEAEFVLFLDHDDYLETDALMILRSALQESPEFVAAYGLPRDVNSSGEPKTLSIRDAFAYHRVYFPFLIKDGPLNPEDPDRFSNLVIWPSMETPGQMLIRVSALEKAGLFDPYTVPSDEWDLAIRLSLYSPLKRILKFTINKRDHETNLYKKDKVMSGVESRLRCKLAKMDSLSFDQKKQLRLGYLASTLFRLSWVKHDIQTRNFSRGFRRLVGIVINYWKYLLNLANYYKHWPTEDRPL